MVQFSENAASVVEHACKEALKRNHQYIEPIHFLWSTYHVYTPQPAVEWLEKVGVDPETVRKHFGSDDPLKQCSAYNGGDLERIGAPVSPHLQRIFEISALLSDDHVVMVEDVIRTFLSHGKSQVTDILEICSKGKVRPFTVGLPEVNVIAEEATESPEWEQMEDFSRFDK